MIAYVLLRGDEGTRGCMGASEMGDVMNRVQYLISINQYPKLFLAIALGVVISSQLLPPAPNVRHQRRQFLFFTGRTSPRSLIFYCSPTGSTYILYDAYLYLPMPT